MTEQKSKPSANPNAISAQKLKEVIENPKKDIDLFYALSKAKLLFWARLVDPTFRWPKHIRYVADRLERVHTRKNQRLIIELPPRHGKACADNQYVPTLSGWKKHGDLKVGDYVFGGDGNPVRITAVSAPVMVDCEIGFMDGTSIVVHENHEWLICERGISKSSKRKDARVRIVETKYLYDRKLISGKFKPRCTFQLPKRPRLIAPAQDLPMDPYVFGAWLGDGSSGAALMTCCREDSEYFIKEFSIRGYDYTSIIVHPTTGVVGIRYGEGRHKRNAFCDQLRESGVWKNKHIPEIYKFASIEQRLDLLAGLIDTDGSVGSDRRVRIVTGSRRLAYDIVDVVHSLGWRAGVNVQKPVLSSSGIQGKKDIYYVGFTPDGDIPTVLPRKKISGFRDAQRAVGFKYVKKCKPVRGRCIEVEGGLYVVGRGMHVTHNSTLSTKVFPAWYLGNNPDKRVITASSTTNLATSFSRYTRNIFREFAPKVFGHSIASDSKGSARWDISGHQGGLLAAGVGKQISGFGADCVAEGTMIATEAGDIAVEHLVRLSVKPRVWSFNHQTGEAELKNVIATRETEATQLYSIGTSDGRKIEVTGRHRIFDRQRQEYRKAEVLSQGTGLIAISDKNQKAMSDVREGEAFPVKIMQKMLSRGPEGRGRVHLHLLRRAWEKASVRIREGVEKWLQRPLLLLQVQLCSPCGQESEKMYYLRRANKEQNEEILRGWLPGEGKACQEENKRQAMLYLQGGFYSEKFKDHVLREGLRRQASLKSSIGDGQCKLSAWDKLSGFIHQNETRHTGEGQFSVCHLSREANEPSNHLERKNPKADEYLHSSHQSHPSRQQAGESNSDVLSLPRNTPHVGPDSISSLERRSCKPVKVYDIQVEGNSNFFAGEILVHNCLIIDDAVRNAEEAYSQTSRDKVWTWYVNDARTRLHSGGSIILVGTRWHEDDIIGRALDDEDEKWERIRLPALSEGDGDLLGREEGKALWPAMFDLDYFRAPMKETNVWSALYQQNPVPIGGGIIKRDWIKYYDALPEASTSYLQSWDMTFKKTNNGSYVVGQVWCRDKANFYLVDQVRKRCNFADTLESVKIMISKWPKCNRILVEDKANGPAIISMLRKDIPGVLAIKADVSKEARLRSVEPYFEAGNVFFPSPDTHAWVKELVAEVTSFPSCKYDDQVDAMSQALSKYRDDYATMPTDADLSFGRRQSPWRM